MEYKDLQLILSDTKVKDFLMDSLHESMSNLGFSKDLISEFLGSIDILDIQSFIEKHKEELSVVQLNHFFGELVPEYFNTNIVSEIPVGLKVLDLGCGRGTLIREIIKRGENSEIVGIDIKKDNEWDGLIKDGVRMEVVEEKDFLSILQRESPGVVVVTWVFHHMEYEQQKRYISSLHSVMKEGGLLIVLEDSYSTVLPPESGHDRYNKFMRLGIEDRQKVIGVLDWVANRIFSMRTTMPVPFAYRTLEGWCAVFFETGFKVVKQRFLGFPDDRDVNNPQSVLILKK